MRKVNIMIDVSDEVYDLVVAPFKKSRRFSKLINSLLEGYISDDYVAAYVSGSLDDFKKRSTESLNQALSAMNNSLEMVGMLSDEAEELAKEGINAVGMRDSSEAKHDTNIGVKSSSIDAPVGSAPAPEAKDEKNDELRVEIDELKRQNEKMNADLQKLMEALNKGFMGMMESASASGGSDSEETVRSEKEKPTVVREEASSSVESTENTHTDGDLNLSEDDPLAGDVSFDDDLGEFDLFGNDKDENEDEDEDFLNGLLAGQVVSV